MKNEYKLQSNYFYGNEISEYGEECGWVDYRTLAKAFNHVLANGIMEATAEIGFWDIYNGLEYDEENDSYVEIFQYYIIDAWGAEILEAWTSEIVFYNEELDLYVWGVTHWGTSWDHVLTDIKIWKDEKQC